MDQGTDRTLIAKQFRAPGSGTRVALFAVSYEPHAGCFFNGDDPMGLMRSIPKLLALHIEPREPWSSLAELDPFSCNLRLQAISAATQEELGKVFRLVPDQVRVVAIPSDAVRQLPTLGIIGDDTYVLVGAIIEEQRQVLRAAKSGEDYTGRFGAAARAAANALRHGRHHKWAERIERAGAVAVSQSDATFLLSAIDEALLALARSDLKASSAPTTEAPVRRASRLLRVDE